MLAKSCFVLFFVIYSSESSLLGKYIATRQLNFTGFDQQQIRVHPDYGLDVYGFLKKFDYPQETHTVTTEDGYILRMQRIPYGRYGNRTSKFKTRPPVLLQHGLASSGVDFINRGPNSSIGFLLADAGWDVWLGNNRGTTWSRKHVTLDPEKHKQFWDYSFNECGYYDLPAMIDHILSVTHHKKVFYIGHSQGTSQFFAMAATRPSYNKKIALMSAFAPVAYMNHMTSPLPRFAANYIDILAPLFDAIGLTHVSRSSLIAEFAKDLCSDGSKFQELCGVAIHLLCGFSQNQLDLSFLPVIAYNAPAGLSMKMLSHYGQEIHAGRFRKFDFGMKSNFKKYKIAEPPYYNVSAITSPVALYYSQNDFFAAVQDVELLASKLPNLTKSYIVKDRFFSHVDFIWGKDIKELLNNEVIAHMEQYVDDRIIDSGAIRSKTAFICIVPSLVFLFLFL